MMRRLPALLSTCILLACLSQLALADAPDDYRHLMPLLVQHEGGQHRLLLPADVYLHAEQPSLTDLRIFNASRESLPYAFSSEPAAAPAKPAQHALNWFALPDNTSDTLTLGTEAHLSVTLHPDGTLTASRDHAPPISAHARRYLIDASQLKHPGHALEIDADDVQGNTLHHLTIEASDDLRNWRMLADHAPWLDLRSDTVQLTRKRVEFTKIRSKYFRLSWEDTPVPIRQVTLETTADNAPANYLQHTLQIPQMKSNSPDYEFELPPSLVLERLRLILTQADSVASMHIFVRHAEHDPWQSVSAATFYRISRDNTEISSPAHALPGIRARYWRIHVDRYSAEFPAALQIEIGWRPLQVVFLASGSSPYTLAFGNRKAKAASFPLHTLLPGYHSGDELKLPLAATGVIASRATSAGGASFMDKWREMEWKSLLLWVILTLGVALLGWMAWNIKKGLQE